MKCDSFEPMACVDGRCPNAQYEAACERFDCGIAADMGLEHTTCGKCSYRKDNDCGNCMFYGMGSGYCPKENEQGSAK